ncbi:hypothetical protein [Cryptosporangium aurantiacum]|uniref:Uncharacterized protein n=1 Tax=Cryptosporangium aurantiacum TaxID=134849 RepID=A0A1M7RNJ3_9ACTN|nr:hypothetical protein [Cryptosporangium aurantiacum]SHN47628.1 hypothetical protein SAMN05443668_12610 [Cryptosporangium aurantiacum]
MTFGYDWLQLAPVLEGGKERILAARPVNKRVAVGLAVLNGLALIVGGCFAAALTLTASALVFGLLRRPGHHRARTIGAIAILIVAIVLYVAVALAVRQLR